MDRDEFYEDERDKVVWVPGGRAYVISGGQVGADIAGVRAAESCGLTTGGMMPRGFRTLFGPMPREIVKRYGFHESEKVNYSVRTKHNVDTADATIRLAYDWNSPGEKLTLKYINAAGKPYFDVQVHHSPDGGFVIHENPEVVAQWILDNEIEWLNIAGNGDVRIEPCVQAFMTQVFTILRLNSV